MNATVTYILVHILDERRRENITFVQIVLLKDN